MSRILSVLATTLLMGGLVACTDSGANSDDPIQRQIDIYTAVIPDIAVHGRPDLAGEEELDVVVYVAPMEAVEIGVDVQVGVVVELEEWATIRFIDEWEEATIGDESHQEVRDGGVLIRLGAIPDGTATVELEADRFLRADHLVTFNLTLRRRGGDWTVDRPIEATPVTLS